jgi:hypothetical protein
MSHPEGRVLAVQQQMFFAQILAEKMEMDTENILRKLSLAGLKLTADDGEIAVDAAVILPRLDKTFEHKLHIVPTGDKL